MSVFKSVFLSLIYLFIYVTFSTATSEAEDIATDVRKGNVVDNFSIEELLNDHSSTLPDANLKELNYHSDWIFEKGPGMTPAGSVDRNYETLFNKGQSRFICWEITVKHKADPSHRNLDFAFRLFDEDDNKLVDDISDSWIPAGQEITDHSACWGFPYPNNWSAGRYYFEIVPQTSNESSKEDKTRRIAFEII